jgi:hypothetical protein
MKNTFISSQFQELKEKAFRDTGFSKDGKEEVD